MDRFNIPRAHVSDEDHYLGLYYLHNFGSNSNQLVFDKDLSFAVYFANLIEALKFEYFY